MFAENTIMYHYCSVDTLMELMQVTPSGCHMYKLSDKLDNRMFAASFERVIKNTNMKMRPIPSC